MKFIHIAGTNGKGSCVEMIYNILITQGYKVGRSSSPHLINYNERIAINKKEISDFDLLSLIRELDPLIKKYNSKRLVKVTAFEVETMITLLYFYRNKVDFAILETGLGGLYDCSNIISAPLISIITSIGYDHTDILGGNLVSIAKQKAGIIKRGSNTIFFEQESEINRVIIETAKEKESNLILIKKDDIKNININSDFQSFDYKELHGLKIRLKGKKQIKNAVIAIEACNILKRLGYNVSLRSVRQGLEAAFLPARFEILSTEPKIIYDGAHNPEAITNFIDIINTYYASENKVFIVSILKRKDYEKMIEILIEGADGEFIFTSGESSDFVTSEELFKIALKYRNKQMISQKSLRESVIYINQRKRGVSFFIGSFYPYKEIVNLVKNIVLK